jgi:hypothetical protein
VYIADRRGIPAVDGSVTAHRRGTKGRSFDRPSTPPKSPATIEGFGAVLEHLEGTGPAAG